MLVWSCSGIGICEINQWSLLQHLCFYVPNHSFTILLSPLDRILLHTLPPYLPSYATMSLCSVAKCFLRSSNHYIIPLSLSKNIFITRAKNNYILSPRYLSHLFTLHNPSLNSWISVRWPCPGSLPTLPPHAASLSTPAASSSTPAASF